MNLPRMFIGHFSETTPKMALCCFQVSFKLARVLRTPVPMVNNTHPDSRVSPGCRRSICLTGSGTLGPV